MTVSITSPSGQHSEGPHDTGRQLSLRCPFPSFRAQPSSIPFLPRLLQGICACRPWLDALPPHTLCLHASQGYSEITSSGKSSVIQPQFQCLCSTTPSFFASCLSLQT